MRTHGSFALIKFLERSENTTLKLLDLEVGIAVEMHSSI